MIARSSDRRDSVDELIAFCACNCSFLSVEIRESMKTSQRARAIAAVWLSFAAAISSLRADSATWLQNPADGNWNNAANWTAGGPPNGSSDEATFAVSNQTKISLSAATEVGGINFSFGAGPFTISVGPVLGLTIGGAGIFNGSVTNSNFEAVGGSANGCEKAAGSSYFPAEPQEKEIL